LKVKEERRWIFETDRGKRKATGNKVRRKFRVHKNCRLNRDLVAQESWRPG
jgi:hypothetical protein